MASVNEQIAHEQSYVDVLYARIDEQIAHLEKQLKAIAKDQQGSTHQNRSERDAFASFYEDRIALLKSVAHNAVFGRLDMADEATHYIGRIGVFTAEREQLLVDWRAPAAAAFYQATPRHPLGVRLRRHLVANDRTITGIEDDVLDSSLLSSGDHDATQTLQGEGALLAAVSAKRTGRMGDIVATIQAEQDRIIRHDTRGVLVVQGGPGTGKTAVALHRAAYQLYTHRRRLEHSGVLIVAPTKGFLQYIERVLPSLGESGVVMVTPGDLLPGLAAERHDDSEIATVKGDLAMAKILRKAVRARQLVPDSPIRLSIDGISITLEPKLVKAARKEARATGRPHNDARTTFVRAALDGLVEVYAAELKKLGHSYADEDRADLIADLRSNHDVKVALNRCWLPYTPQSFLRSFFADPARIQHAAGKHMPRKQALRMQRAKTSEWTVEDIPLLDEVAELLGEDDAVAQKERERQAESERAEVSYAGAVLDMMDAEGIVSAEDLAAHVGRRRDGRTLAERALADRAWTYGHIVVDEAQELSPMMWRSLMRRNPTKSFTIVGDVAQTSAPAGAHNWNDALAPFVEDRAAVEELTVNYRTPSRIMRAARAMAEAHDVHVTAVKSVREGEWDPVFTRTTESAAGQDLAQAVSEALGRTGGRVCVIAPDIHVDAFAHVLVERFGAARVGLGSHGVDREISVMGPTDAKGLEFDAAIVVFPERIVAAHSHGANDLFVAMTRPTQYEVLLHAGDLPAGLA